MRNSLNMSMRDAPGALYLGNMWCTGTL
jgi:hypothetical protein